MPTIVPEAEKEVVAEANAEISASDEVDNLGHLC